MFILIVFYLLLLVWIPELDFLISDALCNWRFRLFFSSCVAAIYLCTLLGLAIAWRLNWDCIYHIALSELMELLPLYFYFPVLLRNQSHDLALINQ